jgi:PmbA protein
MKDRELMDAAAKAVQAAKSAGADQSEAMIQQASVFTARVREGKPDLVKQATTRGLGLRVFVGGKPGFAASSDLRPESLSSLAAKAVALARAGEADSFAGLPEDAGDAADEKALQIFDAELAGLSTDRKIALAKAVEEAAKAADPRIQQVENSSFSSTIATVTLVNSRGLTRQYHATLGSLSTRALVNDKGGKQQDGGYGTNRRYLSDMESPEAVGKEAARLALEKIGPVKISTRKAPVLMHPDIASSWIGSMSGAFSGEQVFKKASWLTEKMGQPVASPLVTLIDDGTMTRGTATMPFDGEGQPTRRNVLIDKGVVTTFLYDTYHARKAGAKSTGSAARSYDAVPFIATRNLYIEQGTSTLEEMLNAYPALFYMKDQGAFGYSPATGGYSYQAAGLWIEKGKVVHPVDEITVASTSLEMLTGIVKVGNDLKWNGFTNSPHLLIEEMTISGAAEQPAG